MKKKFLAILVCLMLVIAVLSTSALAAKVIDSGSCGDNLTWKLDADGTLTISGEGAMADLFDEDTNAADNAWSKYRLDVKIVVIEEGVTSISDHAFHNCRNITEVRISSTVSVIGDYIFEGCENLRRFVVDKDNGYYCNDKQGLLYTKDMQLLKCAPFAVNEMVLPEAVLEIAYDAFSDGDFDNIIKCTGDAITYYGTTMYNNTIYYPDNNSTWTEAIKGAFGSNMWIEYDPTTVVIEASGTCGDNLKWTLDMNGVLTISGKGDMYDNYGLGHGWFDYSVTAVIIEDGVTSIGVSAFDGCEIESIIIPDSVTTIGGNAFYLCHNLTEIYIPESVTSIGGEPFWGCSSLKYIRVDKDNPNYCSDESGVLYNKDMTELLQIPRGLTGDYTIKDGVTVIQGFRFVADFDLNSVTIPASVTFIEEYAFESCMNMTGVFVAEDNPNYSSDENGILYNKDKTELVYIPGGFRGELIIPASVSEIEYWAFSDVFTTLEVIRFAGDAPISETDGLIWWATKAYYPANNKTWTEDVMASLGEDVTWIPYTPTDRHQGDVDSNCQITNADLVMVARYIVEIYEAETVNNIKQYGDMDGDDNITNADLVSIARIIVGLA